MDSLRIVKLESQNTTLTDLTLQSLRLTAREQSRRHNAGRSSRDLTLVQPVRSNTHNFETDSMIRRGGTGQLSECTHSPDAATATSGTRTRSTTSRRLAAHGALASTAVVRTDNTSNVRRRQGHRITSNVAL